MQVLKSLKGRHRNLVLHRSAVEGRRRKHLRSLLKQLDADRNSFVSRAEARQFFLMSRNFHKCYVQWLQNIDERGVCRLVGGLFDRHGRL